MTTIHLVHDWVTWKHFRTATDTVVERTGRVWCQAPNAPQAGLGHQLAWWVLPDEPLDDDIYAAVYVAQANRRSTGVHGHLGTDAHGHDLGPLVPGWMSEAPTVAKGELFSSSWLGSTTGHATRRAFDAVSRTREARTAGAR